MNEPTPSRELVLGFTSEGGISGHEGCAAEICRLQAEIERLRAEVNSLTEERDRHFKVARNFNTGWSNEQKDNQRLRAALELIGRFSRGQTCCDCVAHQQQIAREALRPADETKP